MDYISNLEQRGSEVEWMNRFIVTDFHQIIELDRELERRRREREWQSQSGADCIAIGTNPNIGGHHSIAIGGYTTNVNNTHAINNITNEDELFLTLTDIWWGNN